MFDQMLDDPNLQVDQWKIYPCETVPWTVIKKWFDEGSYRPYPEQTLIDVILRVKDKVHPWIRLNRVVRDIPSQYILGGIDNPKGRQGGAGWLKQRGGRCDCIRCREVGRDRSRVHEAEMTVREYVGSGAKELVSRGKPLR